MSEEPDDWFSTTMGNFFSTVEAFFTPPEKMATIDGENYAIRRVLGEGGFSFVYLVETFGEPKERYALKRILIQSPEQKAEAETEVKTHKTVGHHKNIVPLLRSGLCPSVVVPGAQDALLLFPYYHRGTLDHVIRHRSERRRVFSQAEVLQIFLGICAGVRVFHSYNLAHRDICPRNVLLTDDDTPVLMDFGSARPARVDITARKEALALEEEAARHCSMPYRAPELFNVPSECSIDEKTDVWSLACTLYSIAFGGYSPFEGASSMALAAMNGKWNVPERYEGIYSSEFIDLIGFCINPNPAERPSLSQMVERANIVLAKYPA